ncbi:unnamed protein product [Toxocara canis]|uniref:Secreted protein n=1 Tax=Toxocara canis TaxID=6265 RepID=A0A183VCN6_TOXCA|nr:unnamed protein product [Toxocara canis]
MPLVFAAVPLLTFILIFFTGVQLQGYGSLAGTLLNWQPCVQAMSTLWFVTPFRKKITHKFTKRTAETTTNVNPTLRANAPRTLQVLSVKTHVSDCE